MERDQLEAANRELLRAIETPPDTGVERRLDSLAARIWRLTDVRGRSLDPGRVCRLLWKLDTVERQVTPQRARHVADAREKLRRFAEHSFDGT